MRMTLHAVDGFALIVQRDEVARYALFAGFWGNEVCQHTLAACMGPGRVIEVETTGRILKRRRRLPRCAHTASIPTLFQKAELKFQNLENVAFVIRHKGLFLEQGPKKGLLPDKGIL